MKGFKFYKILKIKNIFLLSCKWYLNCKTVLNIDTKTINNYDVVVQNYKKHASKTKANNDFYDIILLVGLSFHLQKLVYLVLVFIFNKH